MNPRKQKACSYFPCFNLGIMFLAGCSAVPISRIPSSFEGCPLNAEKLPFIALAGEKHEPILPDGDQPLDQETREASQVRKLLYEAAKSGRIEVASEVLLSGPGGLNQFTEDAKSSSHIHVIENPILHGLQHAADLPSRYTNGTMSLEQSVNNLCLLVYSNPFAQEAMKAAIRGTEEDANASTWLSKIEKKFSTSDHSGITRAKDCQAITTNTSFWKKPSFNIGRFGHAYAFSYYHLVRERYENEEGFLDGINFNYPPEPPLVPSKGSVFDPGISNARERQFFKVIHQLLCDAQEKENKSPVVVLTGSVHTYGIAKYLSAQGVSAPTFSTSEDHRPEPETCKKATGILREICNAPPRKDTGTFLIRALGL